MEKHPIESIMTTTLEQLEKMIDVDTVVGTPVFNDSGAIIIPVSKVGFGFVAGGGEFSQGGLPKNCEKEIGYPFAGGAGAGVSVSPVGFLVIAGNSVNYMPVQKADCVDKFLSKLPTIIKEIKENFEDDEDDDTPEEE